MLRGGRARGARARARARPAAASRTSSCSSAPTRTPTTTGSPRRSSKRAGCELWMHPHHAAHDARRWRIRSARSSADRGRRARAACRSSRCAAGPRSAGAIRSRTSREVIEPAPRAAAGRRGRDRPRQLDASTRRPGTLPRTSCCSSRERRLLISGDHLLGRVSLYFDYGWTPDPVAEFLDGLDTVEPLDARLCLPGHGRPFGDVPAHIEANRVEIASAPRRDRRSDRRDGEADRVRPGAARVRSRRRAWMMSWALTLMLCFLTHLERAGRVERVKSPDEQEPERWRSPVPTAAPP